METTLTFVGTGAEDIISPATPVVLGPRQVKLEFPAGDSEEVSLREDLAPGMDKAAATNLAAVYARGGSARPGGGALNSACAAKSSHPFLRVRYLEEGCGFPSLWERMEALGIDCRVLGFAVNPRNVVLSFPSRLGKLILRGDLMEQEVAPVAIEKMCAWAGGGAVLLNSVKFQALATRIMSQAAHHGLPVYAVLTRSLGAAFALDPVAAHARAVICGAPDAQFLTGISATASVDRAADAAEVLGRHTGSGPAFVTLQEDGVVVADNESMALIHVYCKRGALRVIRKVVRSSPVRVNGCGDVFAQAATIRLMGAGPCPIGGDLSAAVQSAVDGCMAAVRHLGFDGPLSAADFGCEVLRDWGLDGWEAPEVA